MDDIIMDHISSKNDPFVPEKEQTEIYLHEQSIDVRHAVLRMLQEADEWVKQGGGNLSLDDIFGSGG